MYSVSKTKPDAGPSTVQSLTFELGGVQREQRVFGPKTSIDTGHLCDDWDANRLRVTISNTKEQVG